MIKLICVGKIKETYLKEAIFEYQKRISKYTKIEIVEVMDSSVDDRLKCLKIEEDFIKKHLKEKDYLILLDREGEKMNSLEFSDQMEKIELKNSNMTFLIGGSYGVSEHLKERVDKRISFSDLTFPHQLFRVILLEQIYRSYKIRNHESYHK